MAPQAGVNGVIPVAVLQKNPPQSTPRGPKAAAPRLKLVLRRLPPGLTKDEFDTILGEEWKIGAGKVDFTEYKGGKVSKDAAKPSKPTRVYFRVTSQAHVTALGDHIRQLSWQDAAKSYQDSALVGPPTLEFAPYPRIPANKSKQDSRQGTIDQDPEFKKFLEALTNPITKPAPSEEEDKKLAKVTTTPLLEALREKKASKDKPQAKASGKHGRGEPKDDATDRNEKKILTKSGAAKDTSLSTGSDKSRRPSKAEKATAAKEAVKALNKDVASGKGANAASSEKATPSSSDKATPSSSEKATSSPAPERKRGNASIAKSMLQRDLGIGPAANRRRGSKREAPAATSDTGTQPGEVAAGKQKAKDASVTPSSSGSASTAAGEKVATSSTKKERPSRSDRRAFKASLAEKTNTKNQEQKPDGQAKPVAAPAPTILKKPQTAQTPTTPKGPSASRHPPTEPAAARPTPSKADSAAPSRAPPVSKPTVNPNPVPASSGRQAFLKHANASQGITEPLIEEALKVFGAIEKVEIDKRKGFAYVDFAEPEGLQKAIAGSPIKVAQGAVHVLERKEKVVRAPPAGATRGRGGFGGRRAARGGARGGSGSPAVTAGPAASAASPAPVAANPVT